MKKTPFYLALLAGLALVSCSKDSTLNQSHSGESITLKSGVDPYPFEIYEPNVSHLGDHLYEESVYVFNSANASEHTKLDKAFWLMEGAMNSFYADSVYA